MNQPYRYAPRAFDRDGDLLTFHLTAAPLGMTINGATGLIDWTPTVEEGARFLAGQIRSGDRVVTIGAGDVDRAAGALLETLG